ncbi:MAG: DUF2125 domain-containing protein [Pseudomonadota bacterium]
MKVVLRVLLALVVLWSGLWWGAGFLVRSSISSWFEMRAAEGWRAEFADMTSGGFPTRHLTTLESPALADPATGAAWQADSLDFESGAIWPGRITARFAQTPQRLSYFDQTVALTADGMEADLHLKPGAALELERMALTSGAWAMTGDDEPLLKADTLTVAMDQQDIAETYHFDIQADQFTPGPQMRRFLRGSERLPDAFDALQLDMTVTFDRPWDRAALEERRPQPVAIDLTLVEAQWGALRILAAGDLDVDQTGVPTGSITIKAENWREMLVIAQKSGALPRDTVGPIERALNLISGLGGNPNALDVKLNLRDGFIAVGPIPLGQAPRIILR